MKNRSALDASLQRAIDSGALAGVVALAADEGGITYEGAAGVREIGKPAPMTPDTVLWLASMTKAVTAAAAMQLVERGQLHLDRPAGDVVPYLSTVQVLEGFDAAGKPKLRSPKTAVTLRQLLTHSSGFTYTIWSAEATRYEAAVGTPSVLAGVNAAIETPLLFDPGTRWDYGTGMDWVGRMIEAVSGQRLGVFMQDNLFGPLDMGSSGFDITPSMRSRMATMHARGADGGIVPFPLEQPQNAELQAGGHALYSTMPDYLRFLRMFLAGGRAGKTQVLKPETVLAMGQNHLGDAWVTDALVSAAPQLSADCAFHPGIPCKWGLSFLINTEETAEGRSAGSLSWAGLCNSYFWIDPVKKIVGVWGAQLLPFFDAKVVVAVREYETLVNA